MTEIDGVTPRAVETPDDVAGVQRVVRAAASLVAIGLGAHADIGAAPRACDVLLRMDRLSRVLAHEAADMTVTVEAGCPLPVLAATLLQAGQWLPLDPPRPDVTTVGGLIAANLSGPLRASQGTVRDLLLGVRVVGADGAIVSGGGKVVKNVAGYDVPKLYVGALGTLGVITEATFKVRPIPVCEEAVVVACRTPVEAGEIAMAVREAIEPFWLEVAGRDALAEGVGDGAAVAIGCAGIREEVADARARVLAVAERHARRAVAVADGRALRLQLGAFAIEPAAAVLRVGVLPTDIGAVMEVAEAVERGVRCLAHAANGVVRIAIARAAAVAPMLSMLRQRFETVVVERAPASVKDGLDVWGPVGSGLELMRGVKAALDPTGKFAPGRFVVG